MRINTITYLLILLSQLSCKPTYNYFEVQQTTYLDSIPTVSREVYLDSEGRIIKDTYTDYNTSVYSRKTDVTLTSTYQKDLLVKKVTRNHNSDSTVFFLNYDKDGQLKQEKLIHKYDWQRAWSDTAVTTFKYDQNGNKIAETTKPLSFQRDKYTWDYDSLGRLSEHWAFDNEKAIWSERYTYNDSGYYFTRTWYDKNGMPKPTSQDDSNYYPPFTFYIKTDNKGRQVQELVKFSNGTIHSETKTYYDRRNRVTKVKIIDPKTAEWVIQKFKYKNCTQQQINAMRL